MKQIAREVAAKHGVPMVDLKSARRDRPTVLARQEAIYRMRTETLRSLPEIGRFFNRDHTTALHAVRVHSKRLETANKAEANR
jgi:chromosomal replication initiator protein